MIATHNMYMSILWYGLTFLAAVKATPEYAYLSTTNVVPDNSVCLICDLQEIIVVSIITQWLTE